MTTSLGVSVLCLLCEDQINPDLRYIQCPSCSSFFHIGHLIEWTNVDWTCLSCDTNIREKIKDITVILELHSNQISIGFAGENEPRESFPFKIGKPKYVHFCSDVYPGDKFLFGGFFAEELKNLRGVLKAIEVTEKGMVLNVQYLLQILHYGFYRVLKIDPMNHPVVIANSVLSNKEQRNLLQDLLFDVFGFPKLFMSSHQYFGVIGMGSKSGITIELDQDLIIIVPIYQGKIQYTAIRMEFLSDKEMIEENIDLRAEIRDMWIIKKILSYFESTLREIQEKKLNNICNSIIIYDVDNRVRNTEKLIYRLKLMMKERGITNPELKVINEDNTYVSWKGINRFLDLDMLSHDWVTNPSYQEVGRNYLENQDTSKSFERKLQSRAEEISQENEDSLEGLLPKVEISSDDIEAISYIKELCEVIIHPVRTEDLGKLLKLTGHSRLAKISIQPGPQDSRSHIYPKLEYLWLIKLQFLPYFSEKGLDLRSIKESLF